MQPSQYNAIPKHKVAMAVLLVVTPVIVAYVMTATYVTIKATLKIRYVLCHVEN